MSAFFPGTFSSLGHPVCDCHCAVQPKNRQRGTPSLCVSLQIPVYSSPLPSFLRTFSRPPPPSPSLSSPLSLWRSFRVLPSITVSPSSLPRTNRRSLRDRQLKPLLCPNASPHPTLLPSASPLRRQTQTSLGPNKIHLPSDLLLA